MVDFNADIERCLDTLVKGGIILYPTDTVWGIGCDATNAKAVERIFSLKKRTDSKAMIVLVAEERDVLRFVANPDPAVFVYLEQATKPTTVIYEGALGLAENLTGGDGSIAIRISTDIFCRHLIKRFRKPVVSTSANMAGGPTATLFGEINENIRNQVDYIVQYRQDDQQPGVPSTLIKWKKGQAITIRE